MFVGTKVKQEGSIFEEILNAGISRRDFLKACAILSASLGLSSSATPKIVHALENNPRIPVIWLHMQECTGCTESFIRSSAPNLSNIIFDMISLDYHETLAPGAGTAVEKMMEETVHKYRGKYILAIEGSVPTGDNAHYCVVGGKTGESIVKEMAKNALGVVNWGSCAVHGGIPAAYPNPTGAKKTQDLLSGKPVINVPGCPPIADVMSGILAHVVTFGRFPELDHQGRPKAYYGHRIHDTCQRRAFFDAGLFVESFDDDGAKKGWCLYKVGCKGPTTYNACGAMRWNEGTSFPIASGNPCIGCSEEGFWDRGPLFERLSSLPGTAAHINPDTIGLIATGATIGGIAVHATATAIHARNSNKASKEKNSYPSHSNDETLSK